ERTDLRTGPDRRLGLPGGFHRTISQHHDRVHLWIHFSDAVEMGLHDLDGRKLAAGDEFGEATGLHARDVVVHDLFLNCGRYAFAPVTASPRAIILASSLSAALWTASFRRPLIRLDGLLKTSRVLPSACS